MKLFSRCFFIILLLAAPAVLAGCGGDDDVQPLELPDTSSVPLTDQAEVPELVPPAPAVALVNGRAIAQATFDSQLEMRRQAEPYSESEASSEDDSEAGVEAGIEAGAESGSDAEAGTEAVSDDSDAEAGAEAGTDAAVAATAAPPSDAAATAGAPLDAESAADQGPSQKLKLRVLEDLVSLEVAVQEAEAQGYAPAPEELQRTYEEMAQQYGGTEGLNAVLTGVGETTESFREQLRRSLTIKNWRETAFLKVAQVSYDEARAFYDERLEEARHGERMRALQILVPVPFLSSQNAELAKEQARKTAEEILKEAQDGANFEDLIQTRMDPTARAATNDGRVGWLVRGASGFPELEEVLFALKPGEVGGLVETPYSFHIVKALEYRPAGQVSFAEAKPEIILMLANRKIDQAVQARVDELRRQAKIEILDPSLAAAWPPKPAAADGAEGTEGAEGTGETTETREAGEAEGGGDVEAEAAGESAAAPAVGD